MKIIKVPAKSNKQYDFRMAKKWRKKLTCSKAHARKFDDDKPCGTIFEFGADDLQRFYWLGNWGSKNLYVAIQCPTCGKWHYAHSFLPTNVFQYVLETKTPVWDGWKDE